MKMKKFIYKLVIASSILLITSPIITSSAYAFGNNLCNNSNNRSHNFFINYDSKIAKREPITDRNSISLKDISKLEISSNLLEVFLNTTDSDDISMTLNTYEHGPRLQVSKNNSTLKINTPVMNPQVNTNYNDDFSPKLTIDLPKTYNKDLWAHVNLGELKFNKLDLQNVVLNCELGEIKFDELKANSISAAVNLGEIKGNNLVADYFTPSANLGEIKITNVTTKNMYGNPFEGYYASCELMSGENFMSTYCNNNNMGNISNKPMPSREFVSVNCNNTNSNNCPQCNITSSRGDWKNDWINSRINKINNNFTNNTYNASCNPKSIPVGEAVTESKKFSIDSINNIDITTNISDLTVIVEDRKDISAVLKTHENGPHLLADDCSSKNCNTLIIGAICRPNNLISTPEGEELSWSLTLKIPKKYDKNFSVSSSVGNINLPDLTLDEINIHTNVGDMNLGNIKANDISVSSSTGHISGKSLIGDSININTSTGNVDISEVRGCIDTSTSTGNVTINEVCGCIEASTSTGNMSFGIEKLTGDIDFCSSTGALDLTLAKKAQNATINAKSDFGTVNSDLNFNKVYVKSSESIDATIGNGDHDINVTSSTGTIDIH
jgi:DUF4097 and DUF4098 domain-containing protein YvlB